MSNIDENGCLITTEEEKEEHQRWYSDLSPAQRRRIFDIQMALCDLGYGENAQFRMLECYKKAVEQLKKEISSGVRHEPRTDSKPSTDQVSV